jgi:aspartate/methionine/tyrosine aminotransferase
MTSATKMVVFNTPHNPTGHVATEQELAKLAELCIKHDVIAVADEVGMHATSWFSLNFHLKVYENIIFAPHRHLRLADQPGMADRTLTVGSASKLLALTGWRIGWVLGNEVSSA